MGRKRGLAALLRTKVGRFLLGVLIAGGFVLVPGATPASAWGTGVQYYYIDNPYGEIYCGDLALAVSEDPNPPDWFYYNNGIKIDFVSAANKGLYCSQAAPAPAGWITGDLTIQVRFKNPYSGVYVTDWMTCTPRGGIHLTNPDQSYAAGYSARINLGMLGDQRSTYYSGNPNCTGDASYTEEVKVFYHASAALNFAWRDSWWRVSPTIVIVGDWGGVICCESWYV